jgi:hypothetical protein
LDEVPPPDAPIEELAAAYEGQPAADVGLDGGRPTFDEAMDAAPPAPKPRAHDNLMLYLDTEDEA